MGFVGLGGGGGWGEGDDEAGDGAFFVGGGEGGLFGEALEEEGDVFFGEGHGGVGVDVPEEAGGDVGGFDDDGLADEGLGEADELGGGAGAALRGFLRGGGVDFVEVEVDGVVGVGGVGEVVGAGEDDGVHELVLDGDVDGAFEVFGDDGLEVGGVLFWGATGAEDDVAGDGLGFEREGFEVGAVELGGIDVDDAGVDLGEGITGEAAVAPDGGLFVLPLDEHGAGGVGGFRAARGDGGKEGVAEGGVDVGEDGDVLVGLEGIGGVVGGVRVGGVIGDGGGRGG
jgi:hypothetical protein